MERGLRPDREHHRAGVRDLPHPRHHRLERDVTEHIGIVREEHFFVTDLVGDLEQSFTDRGVQAGVDVPD